MRAGYLHSGEGEGEGQVRASEGNALGQNDGKDDAPVLRRGTAGGTRTRAAPRSPPRKTPTWPPRD